MVMNKGIPLQFICVFKCSFLTGQIDAVPSGQLTDGFGSPSHSSSVSLLFVLIQKSMIYKIKQFHFLGCFTWINCSSLHFFPWVIHL